jgi:hypothetical protein
MKERQDLSRLYSLLLLVALPFPLWASPAAPLEPPKIQTLLKPQVYKRVLDREVMTHASLDAVPDQEGMKKYSYYAAMLVRAGFDFTRRIMTDYQLYSKMIPYVDEATFDKRTRVLKLAGGIWNFKLLSWLRFEEVSPRWLKYEIIQGHFQGLKGDIFFETQGEKGTIIYLRGDLTGTRWPPTFVVERGAEIVFDFTGRKMKKYIEEVKTTGEPSSNGSKEKDDFPKPKQNRL